jgi:hypothetical protein
MDLDARTGTEEVQRSLLMGRDLGSFGLQLSQDEAPRADQGEVRPAALGPYRQPRVIGPPAVGGRGP